MRPRDKICSALETPHFHANDEEMSGIYDPITGADMGPTARLSWIAMVGLAAILGLQTINFLRRWGEARRGMLKIHESSWLGIAASAIFLLFVFALFIALVPHIVLSGNFTEFPLGSTNRGLVFGAFITVFIWISLLVIALIGIYSFIRTGAVFWWWLYIVTFVLAVLAGIVAGGLVAATSKDPLQTGLFFAAAGLLLIAGILVALPGNARQQGTAPGFNRAPPRVSQMNSAYPKLS